MEPNTQPRQPSGTPVGGQFAGKSNPESDLELVGPRLQPPYQRTDDVVAYTYKADIVCPSCVLKAVPTPYPATHSAETALDILAQEIGVDRYDEATFDSDDFPKVVFRDQMEAGDVCGSCGERLDTTSVTHGEEIEEAADAYAEAALWSSTDDVGEPLDRSYGIEDFDQDSLAAANLEVAEFWDRAIAEDLTGAWEPSQFGHDFWLTRNGHGAGFWDRDDSGTGAGSKLTAMAKSYGPKTIVVGDDGKLYFA